MLLLAGCCRENGIRTESVKCNESFALDSRSADSLRVSIDIEYPVAGPAAGALEKMQKTLLAAMFGTDGVTADPEQAVADFKSDISEKYRNENLELLGRYLDMKKASAAGAEDLPPVLSRESVTEGHFLPAYGNLCSYVIYQYDYTGGAHGIDKETAVTFDLATGESVTEEDLFKSGYETAMSQALTAHLEEAFENPDDYKMLFVNEIAPNGNFYVTDLGVTYIYGRYEIGPYAIGLIRVTVPWEEISGLLK